MIFFRARRWLHGKISFLKIIKNSELKMFFFTSEFSKQNPRNLIFHFYIDVVVFVNII